MGSRHDIGQLHGQIGAAVVHTSLPRLDWVSPTCILVGASGVRDSGTQGARQEPKVPPLRRQVPMVTHICSGGTLVKRAWLACVCVCRCVGALLSPVPLSIALVSGRRRSVGLLGFALVCVRSLGLKSFL